MTYPKPPKDKTSETITRIIDLGRKIRQAVHEIWLEELKLVRQDRLLLELEEKILHEMERLESQLKQFEAEEKVLETAYQERSLELFKKLCADVKQRISQLNSELVHIGRELRSTEEKKLSEAERIAFEEKRLKLVHQLAEKLKDLEKEIAELAA